MNSKRPAKKFPDSSILSDERVKRAIDGLADEIEKSHSYDAADKLAVLIDTVEKKVAIEVEAQIKLTAKKWAWRFGGIGIGIAIAMAGLGFLGWNVKEPKEYIKRMYEPNEIYADLKSFAQKDVPKALADDDVTDDKDIENIAERIRSANTRSFIQAFENPEQITREQIMAAGSHRPIEVVVSKLLPSHYNEMTSCGVKPKKDRPQAILLRPIAGAAHFPPWMRCQVGYPRIVLEISQIGMVRSKTIDVDLVGVNNRYLDNATLGCDSQDVNQRNLACDFAEIQITDLTASLMEGTSELRRATIRVKDVKVSY